MTSEEMRAARVREVARVQGVLLVLGATFIMAAAVIVLQGCGASSRERSLRTTLTAVDVAAAGFGEWDGKHQLAIVDGAETREAAEAALAAYRGKREAVLLAFEVAYRAVAVAALDDGRDTLDQAIAAAQAAFVLVEHLRTGGSP